MMASLLTVWEPGMNLNFISLNSRSAYSCGMMSNSSILEEISLNSFFSSLTSAIFYSCSAFFFRASFSRFSLASSSTSRTCCPSRELFRSNSWTISLVCFNNLLESRKWSLKAKPSTFLIFCLFLSTYSYLWTHSSILALLLNSSRCPFILSLRLVYYLKQCFSRACLNCVICSLHSSRSLFSSSDSFSSSELDYSLFSSIFMV